MPCRAEIGPACFGACGGQPMSIISERTSASVTTTPSDDDDRAYHRGRAGRGPRGLPTSPRPHPARRPHRRPRHDGRRRRHGRPPARGPTTVFPRSVQGIPGGGTRHRRHHSGSWACGCSSSSPSAATAPASSGPGSRSTSSSSTPRSPPPAWSASPATSRSTSSPAGLYTFSFVSGVPLLVLGRYILRTAIKSARRRGALLQRVVLAGIPSHVDEIAAVLRRESWLGYQVVGAITPPTDYREETASGIRVWGNTDDVAWVVDTLKADTVFVAGGAFATSAHMRQAVWDLEEHNVQVVVAPKVTDVSSERVRMRPVGGLPSCTSTRPAPGTRPLGQAHLRRGRLRRPHRGLRPGPRLRRLPRSGRTTAGPSSSARPGSGATAPSSRASSSARWSSTPRPGSPRSRRSRARAPCSSR